MMRYLALTLGPLLTGLLFAMILEEVIRVWKKRRRK